MTALAEICLVTFDSDVVLVTLMVLIVSTLAALTPAIGGFVVVGMMIKQFGSCVLV